MNLMLEPSYSLLYQDEKDVNECTVDTDCNEREVCEDRKCQGNFNRVLISIQSILDSLNQYEISNELLIKSILIIFVRIQSK